MTPTHNASDLSSEDLELITDRTSHALDHTEQLQALCRTLQRGRPSAEDLDDDPAGDLLKIVAGMGLTLGMIQAALEDVQSVLPKVNTLNDQEAAPRNGTESTARVEA